jgi:hypothetical protein
MLLEEALPIRGTGRSHFGLDHAAHAAGELAVGARPHAKDFQRWQQACAKRSGVSHRIMCEHLHEDLVKSAHGAHSCVGTHFETLRQRLHELESRVKEGTRTAILRAKNALGA